VSIHRHNLDITPYWWYSYWYSYYCSRPNRLRVLLYFCPASRVDSYKEL